MLTGPCLSASRHGCAIVGTSTVFMDEFFDTFLGEVFDFSLQNKGVAPCVFDRVPNQFPRPVGRCGCDKSQVMPFQPGIQVFGLANIKLVEPFGIEYVNIKNAIQTNYCAHEKTRTSTGLLPLPPQGSVSTNSTSWAILRSAYDCLSPLAMPFKDNIGSTQKA